MAPVPREELLVVEDEVGDVLDVVVVVNDAVAVEEEVRVDENLDAVKELEYAANKACGSAALNVLSVGLLQVARPSAPTPQQCHSSSLDR
jgi:hypothetical protein